MERTRRLVDVLVRAVAAIGLCLLLVLATAIVLDALMRGLANSPIDLVREIGDLVAAIGAAACLPIVLWERGNITLRALDSLLPPRLLRFVDFFASLVVTAAVAAMAWQFALFAKKTAAAGDVTWLMSLPKAPFWAVVAAILVLAAFVQAIVSVETFLDEPRTQDKP